LKTIITQVIKTIQGEGPTTGLPVTLIRVAGCQLKCSWCDTKWALDIPDCHDFKISDTKAPFTINNENVEKFIEYLKGFTGINKRILFTGGEPLLYTPLLDKIIESLEDYFFEIETNGVLIANLKNLSFFKKNANKIQLNISPKYDEYLDKYKDDFLRLVNKLNITHNFKFVYRQDLEENLLDFVSKYVPKDSLICFSPMTPDYENMNFELLFHKSCRDTVKFCVKNNYRYSPREHILLFGSDRNENF